MYLDYILFAIGGTLLLISILLGVVLLLSRKRSREYRRVLHDETERIDVLETMKQSGTCSRLTTYTTETAATEETEAITQYQSKFIQQSTSARIQDCTEPLLNSIQGPTGSRTEQSIGKGLDLSPLNGKYELLQEIPGGGMSRTFLVRNMKLGNEWIIKFVDGKHAALANEADVLKKLNHTNLPQIIDIFQNRQGTFLVERYIEGYTLAQVLQQQQQIKEGQIRSWGIELAQVLNYLHNLETPIIHCDLKPSNIMVTYDNHLVLIDFGIAKRQGSDDRAAGLTYRYAAPEQFQGALAKSETAEERFGKLPVQQASWGIDPRTDIYSMGVILYELVMGNVPTLTTQRDIFRVASSGLADVISKCLEIEPSHRYQSAKDLAEALENLNKKQTAMARSLVMQRVASVCCGLALVSGVGTSASGAYINQVETRAIVTMAPSEAVVTEQQGVQILIQKETPNGKVEALEPSKVQWSYSDDNIARLDGDRLVGLNVGETTLHGTYRNKDISLHVTVTEPVGEMVSVSLRYVEGIEVSVYAGNGERDFVDGSLSTCSFVSPESMSADGDRLYISDSGVIRILENGEVSSLYLEPGFLTADRVRSWDGDLYVLTGPWETDDDTYYGFIRITDAGAEFLFYTEAAWSIIPDFAFSSDGTLWFIWQNLGDGTTSLNKLDVQTQEVDRIADLPDGTSSMVFDEADNIYFAVPEKGIILRLGQGDTEWTYFAGVEGERNFIDGEVANFYCPTSLAIENNSLYVLDFDTVRRVVIEGAGARYVETLAGLPVEDTNPEIVLGKGCDVVLGASELATLTINSDGKILLGDPKNSTIYGIES
jgi:serine/threonine protein kinase